MRARQKARTRKAIVDAAGALLARGDKPTLEGIAEAAQVSRATAYRYFPGLDGLLREAAAASLVPRDDDVFNAHAPGDPFERLALLDEHLDRACRTREAMVRLTIAHPERHDRRLQLTEAALAPLAARLGRARIEHLTRALAMVLGAEGFLALNDVAGLDESEAREVRRWAIDALVAAALSEAYSAG